MIWAKRPHHGLHQVTDLSSNSHIVSAFTVGVILTLHRHAAAIIATFCLLQCKLSGYRSTSFFIPLAELSALLYAHIVSLSQV